MTSKHDLVLAACEFRPPKRIPRIESFWDLGPEWAAALGNLDDLSDILVRSPDETFFPSRALHLKDEGGYCYEVDGWGRMIRRRAGAYFYETVAVALPEDADPDAIEFDSPLLPGRYAVDGLSVEASAARVADDKRRWCVFGTTGGPFLRTAFLRGEEQFLMDMAADPGLARALADRVGDHLTAVGVEQLRRWDVGAAGLWISDDMGTNKGPCFSPDAFERILLPAYRRMVRAYKEAGAAHVILHSDGGILPLLDMLVDAGIDGLNPLEPRAGMDLIEIRRRYPRLILMGGIDNSDTLRNGPAEKIIAETEAIIEAGRDGGVVIGAHSIGPDIPLAHYMAYDRTVRTVGTFTSGRRSGQSFSRRGAGSAPPKDPTDAGSGLSQSGVAGSRVACGYWAGS